MFVMYFMYVLMYVVYVCNVRAVCMRVCYVCNDLNARYAMHGTYVSMYEMYGARVC